MGTRLRPATVLVAQTPSAWLLVFSRSRFQSAGELGSFRQASGQEPGGDVGTSSILSAMPLAPDIAPQARWF